MDSDSDLESVTFLTESKLILLRDVNTAVMMNKSASIPHSQNDCLHHHTLIDVRVAHCVVLYKAEMVSEKEMRQAATEAERSRATLHTVEGLAIVMLCSSKPIIRKQAVIMLKEARNLFTILNVPKVRPSSHYLCLFVSLRNFTVRSHCFCLTLCRC